MKFKPLFVTIFTAMTFSSPVFAADRAWFWEKEFWQDKNEATPLARKFYNDLLKFTFCNKSQKIATIAIGYWKEGFGKGKFFITEGWWKVDTDQCKVPFQSGGLATLDFYLNIQVDGKSITDRNFRTAEGDVGGTPGCVESQSFFLPIHESKWKKGCKSSDKEVPFVKIKKANKYSEYSFTHK